MCVPLSVLREYQGDVTDTEDASVKLPEDVLVKAVSSAVVDKQPLPSKSTDENPKSMSTSLADALAATS